MLFYKPSAFRYLGISLILLILVATSGCSPSLVSWTSPAYEPHQFKKVVVFGMFQRLDVRLAFEESLVDALMEIGYPAGHGMTLIPPSYEISSNEDMQRIIKKENFDLVIMASTVDEKKETQYHPGNTGYAYGPYGYDMYNYYNYRYGYNVYYGGYGYGWQDAGYYTEETRYIIECQLYDLSPDAKTETGIIYTGQSQVLESSNIRTLAARYAKILLKDLKENKILN
ncbi:hypothetical protein [Reichenbachiella ulvae]|uniref:DUF4136 domain-containing protein n=1 Tax=Reichenbachiella ulvae TaxID=2980104 RepID=A0ABT3CVH7_9BACT|nr:hypothetical protein [Reichenbachiella ulvae]MCV9387686.1 hypothetical protein [Reichenbachiella ulvae]